MGAMSFSTYCLGLGLKAVAHCPFAESLYQYMLSILLAELVQDGFILFVVSQLQASGAERC